MIVRWLLLSVVLFIGACSRPPTVEVAGERLAGKRDGGSLAFLGIPFAEPPVGDLRWRAPQPLTTTQARRDATQFAAACMQTMRILDWYRYMAESFGESRDYYADLEISEDCLYLNVWTPMPEPDAPLPVMVWIHGGSNISGWSFEPNYYGASLADNGVIVVTVAYRLGVFGFMSHPEIDGANFGFLDIIAALEWIQENIHQFGGDPERVTLFGESGGGHNVISLLATDVAGRLFHRAIAQSAGGYGIEMSTLDEMNQQGLDLAEALGLDGEDSLDQLRTTPARRILETYVDNVSGGYQNPILDGGLFTDYPWKVFNADDYRGVPLLIGSNRDEWLDYIAEDASWADLERTANELEYIDSAAALAAVEAETDPRRAMDRLITADNYVCASQALARASDDAWVNYFSRSRDGDAGRRLGAYHGAEIPYVFDTHDSYMPTTDVDRDLTATIQAYWTTFAASGNPNNEHAPDWPAFESAPNSVLELGNDVRAIPAPEPELCAAFAAGLD